MRSGSAAPAAVIAALALAFALAGCASPAALPDRAGPRTPPAQVLATFAHDHDDFHTLRASVSGNSEKGSFSGAVFVDRDARAFRLYAWKLGGAIAVFDLLIKDGRLSVFVPHTRQLFEAPIAGGAAGGLPAEAFFASYFKPREPVTRTAEPRPPGWVVHESPSTTYWLRDPSLALERQEIPGARAEFGDPIVTADGRVWPTSLRLEPEGRAAGSPLELHFGKVEFDAPLDARKFEMRIPPETTRVATFAELGKQ